MVTDNSNTGGKNPQRRIQPGPFHIPSCCQASPSKRIRGAALLTCHQYRQALLQTAMPKFLSIPSVVRSAFSASCEQQ